MFQPQPTPFASPPFNSFSPSPFSYGIGVGPAPVLDSFYPIGGGGAAQPPAPSSGALRPPQSSTAQSPLPPRVHDQHQLPSSQQQSRNPEDGSPLVKMEEQDPNPHDMAAQQAAAEAYQPALEGPFVGEKTPSSAITQEYAKADPAYVEKTIALPQTYSHYRPIKGDGNCGWRAIAFGYFEKLIDIGNQHQIEGEVARHMSLGHMLANSGGYAYYEDFADPVIELLRELVTHAHNPGLARVILLQRFNDSSEASIIYYFRMLAGTYLKANADTYDSFVQDGVGIAAHCSQTIEIVNREIESLGVVGLSNMLLKPIDFVLEIAYLDRSQGSEVNRYRFPEEAQKRDAASLGPTIYLLYRPDHYDILYRGPPPLDVQVHRAASFTSSIAITSSHGSPAAYAATDMNLLSMMPGFGGGGMGGMGDLTTLAPPCTSASPVGDPFVASQQPGPWMQHFPDGLPSQMPPPVVSPSPLTPSTPSPTMMVASNLGGGHAPTMAQNQSLAPTPGYHIRFSPVQLEYEECKRSSFQEPPFQTTTSSTFKNSVWNRAHYGNPDFHPEEYVPEDDHSDSRGGGKKKRKDSS